MSRVFAVGGLTLDWVRQVSSEVGPNVGGNAAYAAVGAHLVGSRAEVVAVLGADYPPELVGLLEANGIGTGHSRTTSGPSFRVLLDDSGRDRVISYLPGSGSNRELDPSPAQVPEDPSDSGLHICAIPTASQRAFLAGLASRPRVVTLDTVHIPGQIEPSAPELIALARMADVFLPSREEVARFWPGSPETALHRLQDAGVPRAVIKLGAFGSLGLDSGELIRMPAAATKAVDTTGAGDAYCGGFCAALTEGSTFREAMAWGAAAASIVIEDYGLVAALAPDAPVRARQRYRKLEAATEVLAGP